MKTKTKKKYCYLCLFETQPALLFFQWLHSDDKHWPWMQWELKEIEINVILNIVSVNFVYLNSHLCHFVF